MSATERTRPANETPDDDELLQRQKALTLELYNHPDPHVRILAHISERQLGMMELLTDTRKTVSSLVASVDGLATTVREVTGRQESFEQKYSNGGGDAQLTLPLSNS